MKDVLLVVLKILEYLKLKMTSKAHQNGKCIATTAKSSGTHYTNRSMKSNYSRSIADDIIDQ
ncbi:MAG: hypothetical protein ITD40_02710 [Nitrosarchaeum sp.]|nr:hypothetical protein [Nitrosarchaeum sp.]